MAIGWVKWCSARRHYGFIVAQHGEQVFVHQQAVREADWPLQDGDEVIFTIRETPKGLQAQEVIRIAGADEARLRGLLAPGRVAPSRSNGLEAPRQAVRSLPAVAGGHRPQEEHDG